MQKLHLLKFFIRSFWFPCVWRPRDNVALAPKSLCKKSQVSEDFAQWSGSNNIIYYSAWNISIIAVNSVHCLVKFNIKSRPVEFRTGQGTVKSLLYKKRHQGRRDIICHSGLNFYIRLWRRKRKYMPNIRSEDGWW